MSDQTTVASAQNGRQDKKPAPRDRYLDSVRQDLRGLVGLADARGWHAQALDNEHVRVALPFGNVTLEIEPDDVFDEYQEGSKPLALVVTFDIERPPADVERFALGLSGALARLAAVIATPTDAEIAQVKTEIKAAKAKGDKL